MITTPAHWGTLSGSAYLLISSSGQLSSIKNTHPGAPQRSPFALPLQLPDSQRTSVLPTSLAAFGAGGGPKPGLTPAGRLHLEPGSACGRTASPEPFGKSHNPRLKRSASPPHREACTFIAAPALGATASASTRTGRTPLRPSSALSNNPGSGGGGTERRLQTVSRGLVNVSALAPRRLPFEPYAACHRCS